MINKYTIYGERCSGTNYLENLININFDVKLTWEYGWKHWFGFNDLDKSDDTLFICIVRNPVDYINSFYRNPHHLKIKYDKKLDNSKKLDIFLNEEWSSWNDTPGTKHKDFKEQLHDRNIYHPKKRYENIFQLRHLKLKWMIEDLPKKVKNCIFIRHEDLLNNFKQTMIEIKNKGLTVKNVINFPKNTDKYKDQNKKYVKAKNTIPASKIIRNKNFKKFYELKLKYITIDKSNIKSVY